MLPTDIEGFLYRWPEGYFKVFFYTDGEFIKEYVKLMKSDSETYLVDGSSTCSLTKSSSQILEKEALIKMLSKNELQEILDLGKSPTELKTGGCECGSWSKGLNYPHSDWCPLYNAWWHNR